MHGRWRGMIAIGIGAVICSGVALQADAFMEPANGGRAVSVLPGTSQQQDAATARIDDGDELLPLTEITIQQAISAAEVAAPGAIGEIDVEYFRDHLVFNVDVGDVDVKVDALDGSVLAADTTD